MIVEYEKRNGLAFLSFPFMVRLSAPALYTYLISISISLFSLINT